MRGFFLPGAVKQHASMGFVEYQVAAPATPASISKANGINREQGRIKCRVTIVGLWKEIVSGVILRGLCELFRFLFWVTVHSHDSKVDQKSVAMDGGRISRRRMLVKKNVKHRLMRIVASMLCVVWKTQSTTAMSLQGAIPKGILEPRVATDG
jgi:hypothetical protein